MGAFCDAIAKDSGNPEAAYWLTRYLSSYEAQLAAMKQGYCGIRMDIYDDSQYQTALWEKLIAARGRLLHETLDYQVQFVNEYIQFNSDAMGKIYEEQIVICHRGAIGDLTVEECVNNLCQTTIELQRKFGSVPIREET